MNRVKVTECGIESNFNEFNPVSFVDKSAEAMQEFEDWLNENLKSFSFLPFLYTDKKDYELEIILNNILKANFPDRCFEVNITHKLVSIATLNVNTLFLDEIVHFLGFEQERCTYDMGDYNFKDKVMYVYYRRRLKE